MLLRAISSIINSVRCKSLSEASYLIPVRNSYYFPDKKRCLAFEKLYKSIVKPGGFGALITSNLLSDRLFLVHKSVSIDNAHEIIRYYTYYLQRRITEKRAIRTADRDDRTIMTSPFPRSTSLPGDGRIVVRLLPAGGSGLETISYQYPLKLISPSPTVDQKSALVFLLSYGGGLVGGDGVNLSVHVHRGSSLCLVTQGHTKIFKSPSPDVLTSQKMRVHVDEEAAICLLPDPVQPFEDSVYEQTQVFNLGHRASLCLLDWVTQGRVARGEDWSFTTWTGRNEVWTQGSEPGQKGRLLIRDNIILNQDGSKLVGLPLKDTMQKMSVFGTLILRGPVVESLGDFFMAEFAASPRIGSRDFRSKEDQEKESEEKSELEHWRSQRIDLENQQGVLWSAAQIRGCVIVKFGAATVEAGRSWIGSVLIKEGSIARYFGDTALMCVQP